LIYFSRNSDVPLGIFSVPVLGGEEHTVVENADVPIVLPDGTFLLVKLIAQRQRQWFRFWPETGNFKELPVLTKNYNGSSDPGARVLPGGKRALLSGTIPGQVAQKTALFEVDLEAASARMLPIGGYDLSGARAWTVSQDGKSILAATPAETLMRIVSIPLVGRGAPRTLFTVTGDVWFLDEGSDGSVLVSQVDRPAEVVRISERGGPPEKIASFPQVPDMDMLVALPDGRVVAPVQVFGRTRLMAIEKGKAPASLINTADETAAPMTAAGPNHIAFVIGPDPHETIAIADTANGRIIGRIAPGKGAILSLAASPDGAALYFAAGGSVWSVASTGGDAHRISAGDGVVADPAGRELVVVRKDSSRILLFRMPVNGGPEQAVPLDSAARVYYMVVSPGTMRGDGRMLLSLNILDSWFNPLALLRHDFGPRHAPGGRRCKRPAFLRLDARWQDCHDPAGIECDDLEVHAGGPLISIAALLTCAAGLPE
jgi:eukaryotic-like serine/threonine-protein kinase